MKSPRVSSCLTLILMGSATASASPFFIVQKDTRYTQTAGSAPTTPTGYDFFATVTSPGTFDGGTVTVPVTSQLLSLTSSGASLQFGSGVITDQSTFTSTYPTGTYSFHLTDSTNSGHTQDATIDDSVEDFAPIP